MKVAFVTSNRHKAEEVKDILKDYPVEIERVDMEYEEKQSLSLEEIAREAALKVANDLKRPIILEDTGVYFEAYPDFPGVMAKFVFSTLNFEGMLKLLDGERRDAYFKTVASFCEPGKEPILFEGILRGAISHEARNEGMDRAPYDHIFIPQGKEKTISEMTLNEKNTFSQRAQAFRKFGEYLKARR